MLHLDKARAEEEFYNKYLEYLGLAEGTASDVVEHHHYTRTTKPANPELGMLYLELAREYKDLSQRARVEREYPELT